MQPLSETCRVAIGSALLLHEKFKRQYISDPHVYIESVGNNLEYALLPNLFIWDPLTDYNLTYLSCPLCIQDNAEKIGKLKVTDVWELGNSTSSMPRRIWDEGWYAILVGRLYRCMGDISHRVTSYHAGILKQIPWQRVPFVLSHDSGMSTATYDLIVRLMQNGYSFASCEKLLAEMFMDKTARKLARHGVDPSALPERYTKHLAPSDTFIRQCFIVNYENNKITFQREMSLLEFESLSFDFTYELPVKIGYQEQNKWFTKYDGVCIVMSEKGYVKAYELTLRDNPTDVVTPILSKLKLQRSSLDMCVIGDCCGLQNQIASIFPSVIIKRDISYTCKLLCDEIFKSGPVPPQFLRDLKMVFRAPDDVGTKRSKPSPSPRILLARIDTFFAKLSDEGYDSRIEMDNDLERQIALLKLHIAGGCLSDLPPGLGDIGKDILHAKLSSTMQTMRMSEPTARGLLEVIFYAHNCKMKGSKFVDSIISKRESHENRVTYSVQALKGMHDHPGAFDHLYTIGLRSTTVSISLIAGMILKLASRVPEELKDRFYSIQGISGLPLQSWDLNTYIACCSRFESVPPDDIAFIRDEMGYNIVDCDLPNSLFHSFFRIIQEEIRFPFDEEISKNLRLICSDETGKISFESFVAHAAPLINEQYQAQPIVIEREGEEPVHQQFSEESALRFMTEGCFVEGFEVGIGRMIQLAVNITHIPLLIVPLVCSMPSMPVLPRLGKELANFCILTVDMNLNFGILKRPEAAVSCRCGANDKIEKMRCKDTKRCKCFLTGQKCSELCKCKACVNGKPAKEKSVSIRRRSRQQNTLSQKQTHTDSVTLSVSNSDTDNSTAEIVVDLSLDVTMIQRHVLEAALYVYCCENNCSFLDVDNSSVCQTLFELYNSVFEMRHSYVQLHDLTPLEYFAVEKWLESKDDNIISAQIMIPT